MVRELFHDQDSFPAQNSFPVQKKIKKRLSVVARLKERYAERDDDLELAIGLSVSHEITRRESNIILSTQEYQEDERRRTEIINQVDNVEDENVALMSISDMFAEGNTELNTSDEVGKGTPPKTMLDEDTDEEEDDIPLSQYVPYGILKEREAAEKERRKKEEDPRGNDNEIIEETNTIKPTSKEVFNPPDDTMAPMYIGENMDATMVPMSRSVFVGQRPQPTVIIKRKVDNVSDTSHSRIIHNFSDPPPVGRDFTR